MTIKNENVLLSIGMISLVIALVLGRFGPDTSIAHFLEGLFMGLSLVLNLAFLLRLRAKKNNDQEQ